MNYRNLSVKLSIALFLMLIFDFTIGQTFKYTPSSFNITLPILSATNPNQNNPLPFYTVFIEPGNGMYYKDDNQKYLGAGENATPSYDVLYNYTVSNSEAVLKIIGHYDTIKPPKSLYSYGPFSNTSQTQPTQNKLAGNRIGFDYSDRIVIPGDTMTLVLTYRPDKTANYMVAFFYNDNTPSGQNVFPEFTDPNQTYTFSYATGGIPGTRQVKAIRVRNETVTIVPTGIPPQISADVSNAKGNFNSALYFMVPPSAKSEEKNIFISMSALKTNQFGTSTNIKAVLFKYNASGLISPTFPVTDQLEIGQFASDPNRIKTTPNCLNALPGEQFNQPLKYEINFQNDGAGDSKNVEVSVLIPKGIQFPKSGPLNINSTVSRHALTFKEKTNSEIKSPNTYELVTIGGQRKIIFIMNGINLPGTSNLESRGDVLKRHGIISFSLNTISKKSAFPNTSIPSCMFSDVSIVFFSIRGTQIIRNTPITGWDLIRDNCYTHTPPCPRTNTANLPHQTQ